MLQSKSKILTDDYIESSRGLSKAPVVVNQMTLPLPETRPPVIFSPGRCGSNIYWSILQGQYYNPETRTGITYRHHDFENNEDMRQVLDSKFVHLLLRRNLSECILSKLVSEHYRFMISNTDNFASHEAEVQDWVPFKATQKQTFDEVDSVLYFLDYALLLRYAQKKMSLAYFEDLDPNKMTAIKFKKNPYDKQVLVENVGDVVKWINDYENTAVIQSVLKQFEGIEVG